MNRILLPFTGGIDARAIEHAITIAQQAHATLLVVSYLRIKPDAAGTLVYPRLGAIEQSQDFMALVRYRSGERHVPTEILEASSQDVPTGIQQLARTYHCYSVLVFVRNGKPVLLSYDEVQQLMADGRVPLFMVSLARRRSFKQAMKDWFIYVASLKGRRLKDYPLPVITKPLSGKSESSTPRRTISGSV